jgi:hypothetical protein
MQFPLDSPDLAFLPVDLPPVVPLPTLEDALLVAENTTGERARSGVGPNRDRGRRVRDGRDEQRPRGDYPEHDLYDNGPHHDSFPRE